MKQTETVIGFHAVKSILETRSKDVHKILFVQSNRHDKRMNELIQLAELAKVHCEQVSLSSLPTRLQHAKHQGVIAECAALTPWSEGDLMDAVSATTSPVILLVLDEVQDPHNLGACLRSANAMGALAVIVPKDRSAKVTEVVRKVSSGAAEQTPVVAVTNLNRTIKQLQEMGVWFVGLDGYADATLESIDLTGPIGIIMGSEGEGMRRLTREACDYLVQIPMQGSVESLNVSVATGIALYEVQRQRQS